MKQSAKQALTVGSICISLYLMRYLIANILSFLSPTLQATGIFTMETIGFFTTAYAVAYACGQLFNGVIGDIVPPKYMVSIGLAAAGVCIVAFPFAGTSVLRIALYGAVGFSLSMLRGPLVKTVSENCEPKYARIASAFLSCACCLGPLFVSILAVLFAWKQVYLVSGGISLGAAVLAYSVLTLLERRGVIRPMRDHEKKNEEKSSAGQIFRDIFSVFRLEKFMVYLLLGMVFEITTTSIAFWRPTLISEYLGFGVNAANFITTALSFVTAFAPFASLAICRLFRERDLLSIRVLLLLSAGLYVVMAMMPAGARWAAIVAFLAAMLCAMFASGVMWSCYLPGLAKSGKVSSANGILDGAGYIGASVMNLLLAGIVGRVGWKGTILVWAGIMFVGAVITLFRREK